MVTRHLPPSYSATRDSLHRLAEHVLSPARYAVTGRIGLRQSPGGFATPPFGEPARTIGVDGDELVISGQSKTQRTRITTIADAGRFVGIAPGAPSEVYSPNTQLDLDAALAVDREAVEVIAMWYELIAMALAAFATSIAEDEPDEAQLWPEHFDLAMSADRINYGGSPGDDYIDVPYLYVGPSKDDESGRYFWNQPFGAAIGFDEIATISGPFEFFRRGRMLTTNHAEREPSAHPLAALTRTMTVARVIRARGQQERDASATVLVAGISPRECWP